MRVVIVTGGTAGLGRAMVLALLSAGHRVVAVGRTGAGELVQAERLLIATGDVTSPEDCAAVVARTLEHFGTVDALVNNAGINLPTRLPGAMGPQTKEGPKFYELSVEQYRSIMRTNVDGAFFMARAVMPHLVKRGWGRIVNHVTSYRTMVRGGETPYGSSKAALESMTAIWANELKGTGVTVNAILPGGAADTRMIAREVVPDRSKLVPPAMFDAPIRWLISDASNAVTGHRFIAALWSANASDEENVEKAGSVAGWPESVATAVARPWPPA
ncbi:MAG TPA: SDR family oxidoreductase [Candidatus Binatia bacterium]|nr:SDR family oxidoreductase [Candidatus Binatia bacterium]